MGSSVNAFISACDYIDIEDIKRRVMAEDVTVIEYFNIRKTVGTTYTYNIKLKLVIFEPLFKYTTSFRLRLMSKSTKNEYWVARMNSMSNQYINFYTCLYDIIFGYEEKVVKFFTEDYTRDYDIYNEMIFNDFNYQYPFGPCDIVGDLFMKHALWKQNLKIIKLIDENMYYSTTNSSFIMAIETDNIDILKIITKNIVSIGVTRNIISTIYGRTIKSSPKVDDFLSELYCVQRTDDDGDEGDIKYYKE